ncbi:hypothetical protein GDO78_019420 [Eleutherodactylus coqui]|uniref:Uncharacterized protein n=1 Tax=Eleutherodactylus coqui TaxID=57060 RepID=A0A8J6E905_ELECQ|nr:hypothetical protein GDO78_019420 [Eleutherodactylus coqui]
MPAHIESAQEDQDGGSSGNPDSAGLAAASMELEHRRSARRHSVAIAGTKGSTLAGYTVPTEFKLASFDGIAIKVTALRAHEFMELVIQTTIMARKPLSTIGSVQTKAGQISGMI